MVVLDPVEGHLPCGEVVLEGPEEAHQQLGRRADKLTAAQVEVEQVRRRVDRPQRAVDGERLGVTMRIVFGRDEDGRRTPIFRDTMEQVVFRPYWWIPNSIAVNETLPLARRDYSYLSRHGYEIVKNFEPATVMRVTRQNLDLVAAGKLTIRQRAGYGNALGLVKFLFPNDHNVYFHDTPQKSLFNLSERDHSHGCVRLQHPGDLAKWVLRDDPDWDEKSIDRAMNAGDRKIVPLKRPIHVFIVYFTAFPALDRETGLRWLPDVYGMDPDALGTLLAAASRG